MHSPLRNVIPCCRQCYNVLGGEHKEYWEDVITSFMDKKQLKVSGYTLHAYTCACMYEQYMYLLYICCNATMFPIGYQAIHSEEKSLSWEAHL